MTIIHRFLAALLLLSPLAAEGQVLSRGWEIESWGWLRAATRACAEGAVASACSCGGVRVSSGYCCSGVSQVVGCSLLAVAFATPGCVATGTAVGSGGETLTYSRAGTRTCNVSGTIQTCSANQACVEPEGLLVEPARSNVVVRPTELTNAWWNRVTNGMGITLETGLDGVSNSGGLIRADTTSLRHFYGATAFSLGTSGSNTWSTSYSAKAGTVTKIANLPQNDASYNYSSPYIVAWDMAGSGSFIYSGASSLASSYGMPAISGALGWYRLWSVSTYTASVGNMNMVLVNQTTPTTTQWTTAGTEDFHVWGPQVELGPYPTSFIPAAGSIATRNADVPSVPWPSGAAAAPCVKVTATPELGRPWSVATSTLWSAGTSTAANSARLRTDTSGNLVFDVYDSTATVKTLTAAHGYAAGVTRTIEACALGGTLSISSDGSALSGSVTGTGTGTWGAAPTTLYLGTLSSTGSEAGMSISSISVRAE